MGDDDLAQELISDERFREWVTKLDFPKPGGQDSITPMLFVGSLPEEHGKPMHMTVIAIMDDAFNTHRFRLMRAIGARCSDEGMQPVAVALISEIWVREFTPEEERARGNRQVSDYEDREEWVMLCGATIDGRGALIKAPILRGADAVITGYGPPVSSYDETSGFTKIEPNLLMEFFKGYLVKKFGRAPQQSAAPH